MKSHRTHWTLVVAIAAVGACCTGCRKPADRPVRRAVSPATTQSAPSGPPRFTVSIECPEQVDVGEKFLLQILVENQGNSMQSDVAAYVRFDSGLTSNGSEGPVEREVPPVRPGEPVRVGIVLKATKPGTSSSTVELRVEDQTVASDWTTVTVVGPGGETAAAEPAEATGPPPGPDLGPPLVDNLDALQKLSPIYPVWFDKETRRVVIVGAVCQRQAPLELFACLRGSKEHESVIAVQTKAYVVHAGLQATGAEPGAPVRFDPEYAPPTGTEIEVQVIWNDAEGKRHTARGQDWVRNMETGMAMSSPWVFAGSQFYVNEETGERYYRADVEGDLICVANFPSAVLDVPVESSDSDAALLFDAFTERIPPRGTPVTLILTPKLDKPKPPAEAPKTDESPAADEAAHGEKASEAEPPAD